MDMMSRRDPTRDIDAYFVLGLDDDFADPFLHRTLYNLVKIFRNPNDMESVVKSRVG